MSWKVVRCPQTFFFLICVSACSFMQQMHLVCCLEGDNLRHTQFCWIHFAVCRRRWCCRFTLFFTPVVSVNRQKAQQPKPHCATYQAHCLLPTGHKTQPFVQVLPRNSLVNWHHVPVYDQLINVLLSPYFILCFYPFDSRGVFRALLFVLENSWGTLWQYRTLICFFLGMRVCVRAPVRLRLCLEHQNS